MSSRDRVRNKWQEGTALSILKCNLASPTYPVSIGVYTSLIAAQVERIRLLIGLGSTDLHSAFIAEVNPDLACEQSVSIKESLLRPVCH